MNRTIDSFTRAYIECALWSSTDESTDQGGDPLDKNYSVDDIAQETLDEMISDCARFQADQDENIAAQEGICWARAGHDFWLTRNGHGCGFWDGDWAEPQATLLTEASKAFGAYNLYAGGDGMVYGS